MNYKELNEMQKKKMNTIQNKYFIKWEDDKIMNLIIGKLPEIVLYDQGYEKNNEIINNISNLKKILEEYNYFLIDKSRFLEQVSKEIEYIKKKDKYWFGISIDEIEESMKLHEFCLISGEGGTGKSYFLKLVEEELEKNNIEHLCIYGKFEKKLEDIDVNEIKENSDKGFVFIFDAINEIPENEQKKLIRILKELKKIPTIRIIISYRTNSMDNEIIKEYQKISKCEYKFKGVSFESALQEMIKLAVPDIQIYEDILYSNNPLFLNMLCDVLSSKKVIEQMENSIVTITFILEQYIKKQIKKIFNVDGRKKWEDTKKIAEWMYRNGKKEIDGKNLSNIIEEWETFIGLMRQAGLVQSYKNGGKIYYFFVIESLTHFLIARSLFENISGKNYKEQINIIKYKLNQLKGVEEAFILAIFDNMSPDYKRIKTIIEETGLIERFNIHTLCKIHFKSEDIKKFLKIYNPSNHKNLLYHMAGYTDKPFNCINYLFNYFCKDNKQIAYLSQILSEYSSLDSIKNRLKNILYFIILNDNCNKKLDEAFYFSLLCCASSNEQVRILAMKLLYEIIYLDSVYLEKIITEYNKISDFYVQESIIYILSQMQKNNKKIINFYNNIIKGQENLTAKSIRRIATYIGDKISYINWNRKNLYKYNKNALISNDLDHILHTVDFMNKDFFSFRYWSKTHIDMYEKFLVNNKKDIQNINNYISTKYKCVYDGICNGSINFEDKIMPEIERKLKIEVMDMNSFMESFEKILKYVFEYYNVSVNIDNNNIAIEYFQNSNYMKCIDIATELFYGSMMCNYYTNNFSTYNSNQNIIGYEIYDPLKYGEEINIKSPIPTYNDLIEKLNDCIIDSLEFCNEYNLYWGKDVKSNRKNVLNILKSFKLKKKEWIILSGTIRKGSQKGMNWSETYIINCCSSKKETIYNDGNARYLTIELENYSDDLNLYKNNNIKPWLCKYVKSIDYRLKDIENSNLVLPPSNIISFFDLKLNVSDLSWENDRNEKVIICNNTKSSYYIDVITGTVFMRKDYYDEFIMKNTIKYFIFTERYIESIGFCNETSLHFEIINGEIKKEINNNMDSTEEDLKSKNKCDKCPHNNIKKYVKEDRIDFKIKYLDDL